MDLSRRNEHDPFNLHELLKRERERERLRHVFLGRYLCASSSWTEDLFTVARIESSLFAEKWKCRHRGLFVFFNGKTGNEYTLLKSFHIGQHQAFSSSFMVKGRSVSIVSALVRTML